MRLARRLGGSSCRSLQVSPLLVEDEVLVLRLAESHGALFGVSTEKDIKLLSGQLGLDWKLEVVPEADLYRDESD